MAEGNIFPFRKDSGEASRPWRKGPRIRPCSHYRGIEVDEEAQEVTCKLCGKELNVVEVALLWVAKEEMLDYRVEKIKEFEEKERHRNEKAAERRRKKAVDVAVRSLPLELRNETG